jgi:hypothetical protein
MRTSSGWCCWWASYIYIYIHTFFVFLPPEQPAGMPHGYTKIVQKNFPGDLTQPTYRKYHTIGKIRVFSIGWYSQGAKWNRNPDVLLRDLEWRLTVRMHKLPPMDLWMDTRCMYQPPPYSGCVGLNDQELDAFVGHRKFSTWLGMVKNFVQGLHQHCLRLQSRSQSVGKWQDSARLHLQCLGLWGRRRLRPSQQEWLVFLQTASVHNLWRLYTTSTAQDQSLSESF